MALRTRFAPSPTGFLHVGGARTALFCYLEARRTGGTFVLRIEDTDRERSTQESVQAILDGMQWLGLDYDEGPFYQTQRFDRYQEVIQQLLDADQAYYCYCSKEELDELRAAQMQAGEKPRYDGRYRDFKGKPPAGVKPVIRFKNPLSGDVVFNDRVRGEIRVSNTELDDLIIARADGTPTYNFTVVVDDMDMKITDVIRGDDHVNNTPRQINLYHALNATPPKFAHLPMILGDDGARLSKRHGAVSVLAYRDAGYLPEALLNYLVRLGWSHGDQEVFSLEEMISLFAIEDTNKAAASFNTEKLNWLNAHYLKAKSDDALAELLLPVFSSMGVDVSSGPDVGAAAGLLKDRAQTLVDLAEQARFLYVDFDSYDPKAAKKQLRPVAADGLRALQQALTSLADWSAESIQSCIEQTAADLDVGIGKIGQPLRVAVTGVGAAPSNDQTLAVLGKSKTLQRIEKALAFIANRASEAN